MNDFETMNEELAYKASLFAQADVLWCEAVDNYDCGLKEVGADFENRFREVLNTLCKLGWDAEYMGIA